MILLDTHALLWWLAEPARLSGPARRAIERAKAGGALHVSAISVLEIVTAVRRGRLQLSLPVQDWLAAARALPELRFEPVTLEIAAMAGGFGGEVHGDPADRLIAATAIALGVRLVSADEKLRDSGIVSVVW